MVLRSVILITVIMLAWGQVLAAEPSNTAGATENLDELITILESKTGRQELIEQLKTLQKAKQQVKDSNDPGRLVDWLDIDEQSSTLTREIARQLERFEIGENEFYRYLAAIAAVLVFCLWLYANRLLARFSEKKLVKLRRKWQLGHHRFGLYVRIQKLFGWGFGLLLLLYSLNQILEISEGELILGLSLTELMSQFFTLFFIILLFASIWETANTLMELALSRSPHGRSSRVQTLMPVIRNILLVVLGTLAALVILSELGIDIMPLLAGAGVLGIAVGFGAQTLVKDFLTGITIILEDLLQIGDVVEVGGRIGAVERISIRKIQLRDLEGIVHTVPFGEVTIVDNYTKEFSYYLFNVGVAYKEDTDKVIEHLLQIDKTLRGEDNYKDMILEPLEILGVDQFADSAVIIKARIKTRSHDRWAVGREFNRRIKYTFDEHNIEIPFPHQTLYFGNSNLQIKNAEPSEQPSEGKSQRQQKAKRGGRGDSQDEVED